MPLLLKNVRAVDCKRELFGDVLLDQGKIAEIGTGLSTTGRVVDATGLTLLPSFVELHAHFRDPGFPQKEDIHSGCRAAVHGGYTAVNLMPNTKPVCSDMETVRYVRARAAELGICDVHQTVSITNHFDGEDLRHLDKIDRDVRWLSDDGLGVQRTDTMLRAMRFARQRGIGLMLHEEDNALTHVDSYLMEELPTERDIELALLTGCRTHFCHVSTKRAIDAIIAGKQRGAPITCEVTPHHLALNDQNGGRVAPPLRGEAHREYLIHCLRAGHIDAIATDHAPHTPADKAAGANGFSGLDLSFATCYTTLVDTGRLSLGELSRYMSYAPARLLGVPGGLLEVGQVANLVLVDLSKRFIAGEEHILSRSKNSPMLGAQLSGEIILTLKEGEPVYEKNN